MDDTTVYDYCILATGSRSATDIFRRTKAEWSGLYPAYQALERIMTNVRQMKTVPGYKVTITISVLVKYRSVSRFQTVEQ